MKRFLLTVSFLSVLLLAPYACADHLNVYHRHYVRALAHESRGYSQIQLWNPGPYTVVIEEISILSSIGFVLLRNDGDAFKLPQLLDGYNPGISIDFTEGLCPAACSTAEVRHASGDVVLGTQLEHGSSSLTTRTPYQIGPQQGIMVRPGGTGAFVRATFKWYEK